MNILWLVFKALCKGQKAPKDCANWISIVLGFALLGFPRLVCPSYSHMLISSVQPISLLGAFILIFWFMIDLYMLWIICGLIISLPCKRCISANYPLSFFFITYTSNYISCQRLPEFSYHAPERAVQNTVNYSARHTLHSIFTTAFVLLICICKFDICKIFSTFQCLT